MKWTFATTMTASVGIAAKVTTTANRAAAARAPRMTAAGHTRGADRGGTGVPTTVSAKTCVTGCASTGSSTPAISRSMAEDVGEEVTGVRQLHNELRVNEGRQAA